MSKCWLVPEMTLKLVKNRGPSMSVIGGISNKRGLVNYDIITESNNAENFEHFLIKLKKKCDGIKVLLVLDNLRVHYSKKIQYLFDEKFHQMFLPSYSSKLNPIELLWGYLKKKWA